MSPEPLVSVIIPSFNRAAYLRQAVNSVLEQTYSRWELIVADDGSTDGTADYLAALDDRRVRVVRREHCGNPAAVRNAGIAVARGEYVAFLDSDDAWLPEKLAAQVARFRACPECGWGYTGFSRMDAEGRPLANPAHWRWVPYDGSVFERIVRLEAIVATPTVMVRRRLLVDVGGFDEAIVHAEDYELWTRLALRSDVCVEPRPLSLVRVHEGAHTWNRVAANLAWAQLYRKVAPRIADPRLRTFCRTKRVDCLLSVVATHRRRGETAAATRVLLRVGWIGFRHPRWWLAWIKTLLRAP